MGVGAYFVPLAVVVVCYVLIYLKVRRSERRFALELKKQDRGTAGRSVDRTLPTARAKQRKEVRLAKIIVMVIICWATSWAPYLVVSLLAISFGRSLLTPWSSQAPAMFAKSGSVYNPVSGSGYLTTTTKSDCNRILLAFFEKTVCVRNLPLKISRSRSQTFSVSRMFPCRRRREENGKQQFRFDQTASSASYWRQQ
nr:rhabdomeric opsin [Echiniscus testudo]